jgi:glycosyltransferase involved in cell wall biosynthesis
MKPLVSIIIPAYNCERWIGETIKSALQQTWQNIEIIVVDDGSNDNTLKIAQSFTSEKLQVLKQENKGASAARNAGLRIAQGDYIQFLDADDLLAADKIEVQLKEANNFGSEYLYSASWVSFEEDIECTFIEKHILWQSYGSTVEYLISSWKNKIWMPLHSYLVPISIIVKVGDWNESISRNDDGEYFCRVVLASKGIRFCPDSFCYYRRGISSSLSSQLSYKYALSDLNTFELYEKNIRVIEDSERVRNACAANFQHYIYFFYPNYKDLLKLANEHIERLGGSDVKPFIPKTYVMLSKLVGWKLARRIELWASNNKISWRESKLKLKKSIGI